MSNDDLLSQALNKRRDGYCPHQLAHDGTESVWELISYAYPNKGELFIKARRINCPETMRTFKVKELRPVASGEPTSLLNWQSVGTILEAWLGDKSDGVNFTLQWRPTCYRRGPYLLSVVV